MSKYEPLRVHLEQADDGQLTMTFAEVADLVGGLPPSAYKRRQWWSNNPKTTAPRHAWLPAGRRIGSVVMADQIVTFAVPGSEATSRAAAPKTPIHVDRKPEPTKLETSQITGLEAFLTFRGDSKQLRYRIAEIERSVAGCSSAEAVSAAADWGVNQPLLEGARLAKRVAAQVDVVLHATGIVHALPHVLDPDEVIEAVSLGAGNTGRDFDLETNRQIAEFKFIDWAGGPESVRQDTLLIDIFHLASADTDKRRVMYVTGAHIPLHWLSTSKRVTRECLGRKRRVPARFDARYGLTDHRFVKDYWAAVADLVDLVDLNPLVPGLAGFDSVQSPVNESDDLRG